MSDTSEITISDTRNKRHRRNKRNGLFAAFPFAMMPAPADKPVSEGGLLYGTCNLVSLLWGGAFLFEIEVGVVVVPKQ